MTAWNIYQTVINGRLKQLTEKPREQFVDTFPELICARQQLQF